MFSKNNIFIVEDEIVVANDIKQILTKNGFNVVGIASKYSDAKKKILESSPDLILCDINLRDKKSGIDLMIEISQLIVVKIIFITAYSDFETLKNSNLTNAFSYITKPFNSHQIITSTQLALIAINNEKKISKPTKRELSVVNLLSKGHNSREIGELLFISKDTVDTHRRKMLIKYSAKSSIELVSVFMRNKWISFH